MDKKAKTWSRELSVCMIAFCGALAWKGATEELELVVWPVTVFSLAAFGFRQPAIKDIFGKKDAYGEGNF